MSHTPLDSHETLFTHDGHLSDLTVQRLILGDLPDDARDLVEAHLESCEECLARFETERAAHAAFKRKLPMPPALLEQARAEVARQNLPERRAPAPRPARSNTRARSSPLWMRRAAPAALAACAIIAAAVAMDATRTPTGAPTLDPAQDVQLVTPAPDRIKGNLVKLEVFVHDGQKVRLAEQNESVRPGDRIMFKLFPYTEGYVMIVGVDDRGEVYIGHPQDGRQAARPIEVDGAGVELDDALELDDVPGKERLFALICPEAFTLDDVAKSVSGADSGALSSQCARHEVVLNKRPEP